MFCGYGCPSTSDEVIEHIHISFKHSSMESKLEIPLMTAHKVIHKRLWLYSYRMQLVHMLEPGDRPTQMQFALVILDQTDNFSQGYLSCFRDSDH